MPNRHSNSTPVGILWFKLSRLRAGVFNLDAWALKMKQAFVVLLITMLCACFTAPSEISTQEKNDKWVGLTVDDLIVANGEPANVYTLTKGGRLFEYLQQRKTGGAQSAGDIVSDDRVTRIRAKYKAKKLANDQGCAILFKISASDIIVGWSIEGNGCN